MEGSKERQGDFVFTAKEQGEYRFCFNNEMSTWVEKMVDFEIAVCSLPCPSTSASISPLRPLPSHRPVQTRKPPELTPNPPIQVENESRAAALPSKQGTSPEQTTALEESIYKVSNSLSTINRNQKYFRTRENRNMSTVKSTEGRIFNFSLAESALMVCMAGLQVFVVRFFFQGARKGGCGFVLLWGREANGWGRLCMIALRVAIKLQRLSMSWCHALACQTLQAPTIFDFAAQVLIASGGCRCVHEPLKCC